MDFELLCQCEYEDCDHPYLSVPSGELRAHYVGRLCDSCARTHMADDLITP